ncbi:25 kDa ookinete surface antigen precursor, putative [Plasmodium ovale]|uniref:25 kDa ookinete surface antigen (P25) n=3 Tax=Plasmodium ovale TaxID=36330 RepID=A0A1A8VUL8_PLAOA|nr:25 kDa ookinete surface antigen precursor (P25) [Plasmodium ovale curtisi]SCP03941.1 25 kDa ookinete surface antigen precursor, putative [Plasmodium ovale]
MNTFYSLFLVLFVQLGIQYNNAKVTVDTNCKNGTLVQMSNHLECKCNENFVHVSEDICEEKFECNDKMVNNPCGDYSTCIKNVDQEIEKYICTCISGFEYDNKVCVPAECKGISCVNGKCIVNPSPDNKEGRCSCNIGKVPNPEDNNNCTKDGDTECKLKCTKENEICKNVEGLFECNCQDGFIMDLEQNLCKAYSVFNVLNLSIIFFVSVICSYVI